MKVTPTLAGKQQQQVSTGPHIWGEVTLIIGNILSDRRERNVTIQCSLLIVFCINVNFKYTKMLHDREIKTELSYLSMYLSFS